MPESKFSSTPAAWPDRVLDLARLVSGQVVPQEISEAAWPEISRLAILHGLGPLLWWTLQQHEMDNSHSTVFHDLEISAKVAAFNHQLLQESQSQVDLALMQAGILAIWFKGAALAYSLYPQPQLRPMDDLDVLIPSAQHQAALNVVQSVGYQFTTDNLLEQKLPRPQSLIHHYHMQGGSTGKMILELHFRLLEDDSLMPLSEMDWFLREKEPLVHGNFTFNVLKPEAHLLYLCAHAILQHGESEFRLQRYYDLHKLASQPCMDWEMVVTQARKLGWVYTVGRAMALTGQYFGTLVPGRILEELNNYSTADRDYIQARHLQGAGNRWEMRLLQLSKFSWGERARQLFHLTFPPAEYMRNWYAIPTGRALLPYYFIRWWDAFKEIFASTLRRFRN